MFINVNPLTSSGQKQNTSSMRVSQVYLYLMGLEIITSIPLSEKGMNIRGCFMWVEVALGIDFSRANPCIFCISIISHFSNQITFISW